jgi:hypothetical protein
MWNLRWRARLRRYHNFPGLLGSGNLFNLNWQKAGSAAVGSALNGDSPSEVLSNAESALGGGEQTQVDTYKNKPAAGIFH